MPLLGVIFYFSKAPRYIPEPISRAKIYATFLLTIILPLLLFWLLKSTRKISSIYLPTVEERVIPLGINCIILLIILQRIFSPNDLVELYFFFLGILASTLACLILALLKFKTSIHMVAAGGVLMFIIALSIHFNKNFNGSIALFSIITGAIATSRLHVRAHNTVELTIGFFVGLIPQLILLNYWL